MRKLFLFFAALTLSVGMWAETRTVSYDYPVYNTPDDPKSGIASWQTGSVEATVVEPSDEVVYWGEEGQESWYVVYSGGELQLSKGAVCRGAVHLILTVGTLNASAENDKAGIEVSGSNSLTIYGDANLNAVGGSNGAGIGGGAQGNGSNITINGGTVEATGKNGGAGIGGGKNGSGSNITINGGQVTAYSSGASACIGGGNGGNGTNIIINGGTVTTESGDGVAIGGGKDGQSSNIFAATPILLKAGSTSDDAIETPHLTGYDIAAILKDKRYVKVEEGKAKPYAEGEAAGYARGKNDGINEGKAALPTDPEGAAGHTVTITKGDKTLILVNPDKVTYGKQE